MKTRKLMSVLALMLALTLPVMGLAADTLTATTQPYGAAALTEGQIYTTQQMLTYAIQDEYLAQGEYKAIISTYGNVRPFANIVNAEATHIARLLPLFTAYSIPVPENKAAAYTVVPAALQEAYETGVTAEVHNIAMYESFLKQENLPEDVKLVFEALKNASENHLKAFQNNADKSGKGQGTDNTQGMMGRAQNAQGRGQGRMGRNQRAQGQGAQGNLQGLNYADTNNDGVCDNFGTDAQQNFGGGRNRR